MNELALTLENVEVQGCEWGGGGECDRAPRFQCKNSDGDPIPICARHRCSQCKSLPSPLWSMVDRRYWQPGDATPSFLPTTSTHRKKDL